MKSPKSLSSRLKIPMIAAVGVSGPQPQASLVPAPTIRAFLEGQKLSPAVPRSGLDAAKASVVRVICVNSKLWASAYGPPPPLSESLTHIWRPARRVKRVGIAIGFVSLITIVIGFIMPIGMFGFLAEGFLNRLLRLSVKPFAGRRHRSGSACV